MWTLIAKFVGSNSPLSCFIQSCFETKLIDYLIYNVVDEIFICKIMIELGNNKKKMYLSNHVLCHKHFLDLPPQC